MTPYRDAGPITLALELHLAPYLVHVAELHTDVRGGYLVVHLPLEPLDVGRSPAVLPGPQVRIQMESLVRLHARLTAMPDGTVLVEDLTSARDVRIDGAPVTPSGSLVVAPAEILFSTDVRGVLVRLDRLDR